MNERVSELVNKWDYVTVLACLRLLRSDIAGRRGFESERT